MPKFVTSLIDRIQVAEGTMALAFERPSAFDFRAGQFMLVSLSNPLYTDAKGNRRTFSIASPPQQSGRLEVAFRMTGSALKRSLADMELGAALELLGPSGSFSLWQDSSDSVVLIAGGIGITPFRSMVRDAADLRLPLRITLIYSNRNPESAAFHEEFLKIAYAWSNFVYLPTMTQADKSRRPWDGERRYVDADFLRQYIRDLSIPSFYVAGPPGLVAGIRRALMEAGADLARVHSEEFEGY